MTTRRDVLKAAALASLPQLAWSAFANAGARCALVIGNNAYTRSPLQNPVADARAMDKLLRDAGFAVQLETDAGIHGMAAALDRFGAAVRRSETETAVFYYAGHGAQLDWKNYLLPVDASVRNPSDLKERCLDLGILLQHFSQTRNKTFIVFLDACRDNPFGTDFHTANKGLSQFDAPVGTLLAYATAPGNVALDGEGGNGLYTSNLIRELSVRGAKIEDCLKRVRLSVRLASRGAQIPWESTSLEDDIFLFPNERRKVSEEEVEQQFRHELAAWNRVKGSTKIDDWVAYLRGFPNGRFSEVAQARLTRLLAPVETSQVPPAPAKTAVSTIDIRPGVHTGPLFQPQSNPYSSGTYKLGRNFSVGDVAVYRKSDLLTGVEAGTVVWKVTSVDSSRDRVEYNDGKRVTDLLGNRVKLADRDYDGPLQLLPVELQLGKKWTARAVVTTGGSQRSENEFSLKVAALETVRVPAGEFQAFRIDAIGWNYGKNSRLERRLWVVPGLNFQIKVERTGRSARGVFFQTEREELISLRQAG